jgi:hypothetical protein
MTSPRTKADREGRSKQIGIKFSEENREEKCKGKTMERRKKQMENINKF